MALQEFKCVNCGGKVSFNIEKQKMKCEFCGTEYDNEESHQHIEEQKAEGIIKESKETNGKVERIETDSAIYEQEKNYYSDEEESELLVYSCQSCGGEIIADENTAATFCPYCKNNVVVSSKFSGDLKPDLIIPFKLDKEAAKKALKKFYQGRKLLPKVFEDENNIEEIKGIYVPFWLFSGKANADMRFVGTRLNTYADSTYRYTETSYYNINRAGDLEFNFVPVDGSSKISNLMMESIEPFHWEEAEDFSTYFLPGFFADRYDVESKEVIGSAEDRIKSSTLDSFRSSVGGYSSIREDGYTYDLGKVDIKYALAPVWFLNTKWKDKIYTFAMNGQTGKIVGDDMPIDKSQKTKKVLATSLIVGIIVFIILMLAYPFIFS